MCIRDRLYTDWSTLVKFQRTRGVLRLMAAVIHSLWEKEDRNPLILPCNIPIDDPVSYTHLTWPEEQEQPHLDVAAVLKIMWEQWNQVFGKTLGHTERSLVSELREVRNKWAHQEPFSSDDAYRVLDSSCLLYTSLPLMDMPIPIRRPQIQILLY